MKHLQDVVGCDTYAHHLEQLEWIAANHKPGEPFKLDELMKNELKENVDAIRL